MKSKNITLDALVNYGLTYTPLLLEGDVIEFPDNLANVDAIDVDGQAYIKVLRNSHDYIYFPMWEVRRRDHNLRPVHEVSLHLRDCNNDAERIQRLRGKKIKVGAKKEITCHIFDHDLPAPQTKTKLVYNLTFA